MSTEPETRLVLAPSNLRQNNGKVEMKVLISTPQQTIRILETNAELELCRIIIESV